MSAGGVGFNLIRALTKSLDAELKVESDSLGLTFFITLPLSLELNLASLIWRLPGWVMAGAVVLLLASSLTQYFHGSLHRTTNPWPIRLMRSLGLLMSPAAHKIHHDTLKRDFSVISGWSNPLLNLFVAALRRAGLLDEEGLVPG